MTDVLDITALGSEQKIPVKFLLDVASEIVNEGKADRVVDDHFLVKFQTSDYDAVNNAISSKKTLADLAKDLGVDINVAAELVNQYGSLHPEVPRETIDALVITDHADVRIELAPGAKETDVGKLLNLPLRVYSDRDLKNVQFNVSLTSGLEIAEKPSSLPILPQSEDGYAELLRVKGSAHGKQIMTVNLVGEDSGTLVRRSVQAQILVHPKIPDLSLSVSSLPPQIIYFGKEFPFALQVANNGEGEARNIHIEGIEKFLTSLKIVQDIPSETVIPGGTSIELQVVFVPIISGDLSVEGLALSYSDAEGRTGSKPIPSFATKIITLQPELKVKFSSPKTTGFEDEVRVEYTLSNSGVGTSKNILMRAFPVQSAFLVRGALSRRIIELKQGQTETGQFDFQIDTKAPPVYPIEKIELTFLDEEDVSHKVELSASDLIAPEAQTAMENIPVPIPQTIQTDSVPVTNQQIPIPIPVAVAVTSPPIPPTTAVPMPPASPPAQAPEAPPTVPEKSTLKFMLQTKDSFGTNYPPKKWLSILDDSDQIIDLGVLGLDKNNHAQQGYLNLLIAMYDSKHEDYELEERIKNDQYTQFVLAFLRRIKQKQKVEYDPNGSTYSTIKIILEKLLVPGDSSETKSDDGTRVLLRKLSFTNSLGEEVTLLREAQVSPTQGAINIAFRLADKPPAES